MCIDSLVIPPMAGFFQNDAFCHSEQLPAMGKSEESY
jgi:hypothetical protein